MRASILISLALAPVAILAAPAPVLFEARAQCPATPCKAYTAVVEYCANKYTKHLITGQVLGGTAGISCICGHEGLEAVTNPEDTKDFGYLAVGLCYECGKTTGKPLDLLEAWVVTCATFKEKGVAAAETCWNTAKDCYTG